MRIEMKLPMLIALGGLLAGCGEQEMWVGRPNSGSGGAGGAGDTCAGQCVPLGPYEAGWTEPALLWMGKAAEVPDCPEGAPVAEYVGFADLKAPSPCGACQCERPTGSCALTTTLTVYNTTTYPVPAGAVATSFNAPAGWSGSCTTANAIPAGKQCNGTACVQSLTFVPLTLTESACVSNTLLAFTDDSDTWGSVGRLCRGHAAGECADPGTLCSPAAASTSERFAQCVSHDGEKECPISYPVKHVLYHSLLDNRTCTPCSCEAPTGSICKAMLNVYEDSVCKKLLLSTQVDAEGSMYFDIVPAGSALGSKSEEEAVYGAGSCAPSGGEVLGEVLPTEPTTFCCLP